MCEFALGTVCTTVEKLLGNGAVEDEIAVVESTCISVKNGDAKKIGDLLDFYWDPSDEYDCSERLTWTCHPQSEENRPPLPQLGLGGRTVQKRDVPIVLVLVCII